MSYIKLFREFLKWKKDQERNQKVRRCLCSCELLPYHVGEIVEVLLPLNIPIELFALLAQALWDRQGRGRVTLNEAIALVNVALKS
jgi:hypothetical protein